MAERGVDCEIGYDESPIRERKRDTLQFYMHIDISIISDYSKKTRAYVYLLSIYVDSVCKRGYLVT